MASPKNVHPDRPDTYRIETELTHLGRNPESHQGFVNTPVYRGSTILFPDMQALMKNDAPYVYGRKGTPTTTSLEDAMNHLEKAAGTVLVPSGLGAITCALLAILERGDHLLISDSVYYPTRQFANTMLTRMGVHITYFDPLCGKKIGKYMNDRTRAVYLESPGSHSFEVQNIPAIAEVARKRKAYVLADNTWATPLYHKPLDLGADISIQACTKYITGHSDAMLGTISCNKRAYKKVRKTWEILGNCAGSEEIFLGLRGLRTLKIRLEQHAKNAMEVASWLQQRPEVKKVIYPALPDDPGHKIWKRDFTGASGLFSVILKPCEQEALAAMLNDLRLFGMGWSWGGFESLIVPFELSNIRTATQWKAKGPCLRFHIGLESPADLIADLEAGFARLNRT